MSDDDAPNRLKALIDAASSLLTVQAVLVGVCKDGDHPTAATDDFSLGYVFGFVDGLLQRAKIDQNDPAAVVASTMVFENVFGIDAGPKYFWRCVQCQGPEHAEMFRGIRTGGEKAFDFMTRDSGGYPMGWAYHVLDEHGD
jgi:hypothetical protein